MMMIYAGLFVSVYVEKTVKIFNKVFFCFNKFDGLT